MYKESKENKNKKNNKINSKNKDKSDSNKNDNTNDENNNENIDMDKFADMFELTISQYEILFNKIRNEIDHEHTDVRADNLLRTFAVDNSIGDIIERCLVIGEKDVFAINSGVCEFALCVRVCIYICVCA